MMETHGQWEGATWLTATQRRTSAVAEGRSLQGLTHVASWKRQNGGNRPQSSGCQGLRARVGNPPRRSVLGCGNVSQLWCYLHTCIRC